MNMNEQQIRESLQNRGEMSEIEIDAHIKRHFNIINGNKTIAKFMGYSVVEHYSPYEKSASSLKVPEEKLDYHWRWGNLMLVISKINTHNYTIETNPTRQIYMVKQIYESLVKTNIYDTFLSVYKYIKWYNEENSK